MVYWNFFLVDGVAAFVAVVDDNVIKASSSSNLHCMRSIPCCRTWMHRFCLQIQTYTHTHAHMQTNTFTQSKQREKKLKHQYQLKNMNKEQEPVLGIEKSRLLCNFVGERVRYGVCIGMACVLPHSVFTWKYGVLVVCRRDTMHKLPMLMVLLLLCCTHKFSVIFDFRSIHCLLRQQNHTTVIDEVYNCVCL